MSIPLDQLYHYIDQCAQKSYRDIVIIYRFFPYGSKDLRDLDLLKDRHTPEDILISPELYCNDQEPLDFDRYEKETCYSQEALELLDWAVRSKLNLRDYPGNIWDWAVILHSEQRSSEVEKYCNNSFVPAYYWSHALISLDWFRVAQYLEVKKHLHRKMFLIYNRAWSGTREYRLKFADLLIDTDLHTQCRTTVNPQDPEINLHYNEYDFLNTRYRPGNILENFFDKNKMQSTASAMIDFEDYASTDIEIVLETLFDDNRLHITEKTLRPIACGQPFLLMATHGSLAYLRSYGFKTFADVWPEHYDTMQDPLERMQQVVNVMKQISMWSPELYQSKMAQAAEIAEFNRQHFFSADFAHNICTELQHNLDQAFQQLIEKNTSERWFDDCNRWIEQYQHWQDNQTLANKSDQKFVLEIQRFYNNFDWKNLIEQVKTIQGKKLVSKGDK